MQTGHHVVAEVKVTRVYHNNAEFGLFALLAKAAFRHSLQTWTSDVFKQRSPALREALNAVCRASTDDPVVFTRKRANRSITSVELPTLPSS
ncbi:hypothetical protein GQ600_16224 [Phytophthora cactorum]|nr:hypothetical protein GQ600_16224 [Phytophthora cactorum]